MSLLLIQSPWVTPSWVSNSYLEVPLNTSSETEENPSRGPPFRQYKFFQSVLFHIFSLQKGWSSGVYRSAIPTALSCCLPHRTWGSNSICFFFQILQPLFYIYIFFFTCLIQLNQWNSPKTSPIWHPRLKRSKYLKEKQYYLNPGMVLPVTVHYLTKQDYILECLCSPGKIPEKINLLQDTEERKQSFPCNFPIQSYENGCSRTLHTCCWRTLKHILLSETRVHATNCTKQLKKEPK